MQRDKCDHTGVLEAIDLVIAVDRQSLDRHKSPRQSVAVHVQKATARLNRELIDPRQEPRR